MKFLLFRILPFLIASLTAFGKGLNPLYRAFPRIFARECSLRAEFSNILIHEKFSIKKLKVGI